MATRSEAWCSTHIHDPTTNSCWATNCRVNVSYAEWTTGDRRPASVCVWLSNQPLGDWLILFAHRTNTLTRLWLHNCTANQTLMLCPKVALIYYYPFWSQFQLHLLNARLLCKYITALGPFLTHKTASTTYRVPISRQLSCIHLHTQAYYSPTTLRLIIMFYILYLSSMSHYSIWDSVEWNTVLTLLAVLGRPLQTASVAGPTLRDLPT